VDVFEGVARCIVCRENPARRCAERYCEEIEGERKTDRAGRRKRPEMDERGREEKEREREIEREEENRLENREGRETPALASI